VKTAILGIGTALLILASACAHALLGWPAIEESFRGASVDSGLLAALAIGWYFGSASMAAFSLVVGLQAVNRLRKVPVSTGSLWPIAAMYVLFGSIAMVARNLNPHFILFVVTGLLVGLFTFLCAHQAFGQSADS
jgi:hypothetical protein